MAEAFHRCTHCAGFYEVEESACIYCGYDAPLLEKDGEPKCFPTWEECRDIRVGEWRQLPSDARDDPMGPPADDLAGLCVCLHCGPGGPVFEAIEMRWITNEGMWACPCTRCGGRGYHFDIHDLESKWQCCDCGHKWAPPDGNAKASNCKCPKCGCTNANGWFDDEYSEEEIEAMTEEQYKAAFGQTRAEEEAEQREWREKWEREHPEEAAARRNAPAEDALPWDDEELARSPAEAEADQGIGYDPEAGLAAERQEELLETGGFGLSYPTQLLDDDIDFPHIRDTKERPELDTDIPF